MKFVCWFALLLACHIGSAFAQTVWRAEYVLDGDSLNVRGVHGERLRVRLAGIDAPEKTQPYADRSRKHLRGLVTDCRLSLSGEKRDRYGRTVAQVHCGSRDLALAQIEAGYAWHFERFAHEQHAEQRERYHRAQQQARSERLGLWSDSSPQAPWLHRDQNRNLLKP